MSTASSKAWRKRYETSLRLYYGGRKVKFHWLTPYIVIVEHAGEVTPEDFDLWKIENSLLVLTIESLKSFQYVHNMVPIMS
jgi:hypothetical protein